MLKCNPEFFNIFYKTLYNKNLGPEKSFWINNFFNYLALFEFNNFEIQFFMKLNY